MELSKSNKAIIVADQKGYTITRDGTVYGPTGTKLKLHNHEEYYRFSVKVEKESISVLVNRFQGYKKFGHKIFLKDLEIRHLNGKSFDNSYGNIGIGTHSRNMMDCTKQTRMKRSLQGSAKRRKLTEDQVKNLRQDRANGMMYKELMAKYGVAKSTVSYIVNGKTYNHKV
jgi:hypothetical protein